MAFDAFLKIEGIPGESTDRLHKDWIDILSFSWGVSNTSTGGSGGGGGAGKASVHDFSVVKYIDVASPALFEQCCTGQHVKEAAFELTNQRDQSFYKLTFTDVLISSVSPNGTTGGRAPMEQLSFTFGQVDISAADPKGVFGDHVLCGGSPNTVGHNH
jgi:type VI secretion system secreted protein Hcp